MQRNPLILTGGILAVMIGLGTTDALLVERGTLSDGSVSSVSMPDDVAPVVGLPPPPTIEDSSASSAPGEPPVVGVKRRVETDVIRAAIETSFTTEETREKSLLSGIVQNKETVATRVLLQDGDRAGLVAWVDTPLVKQYFLVLKETLHSLFSPEVKDLLDEVQHPEGKPVRNFLTFLDPAISEERLIFVRVRERLYEFHITAGKEDAVSQLIEKLTQ